MSKRSETTDRDLERVRAALDSERQSAPTYQKSRSAKSCLLFVVVLLVVAAIAYYVLTHQEKFGRLLLKTPKPDTAQVDPNEGVY